MPLWQTLNATRQVVILDLAYNVGLAGFYRFKRMIGALTQGDYERASDEMIDSKWYRQTGRRAKKLVKLMRSGVLR